MKEQFLQLIWKLKLFNHSSLKLLDGRSLIIKDYGIFNAIESGPDFLNAMIKLEKLTWSGNIEIHLKSSDWYRHKHHSDPAYNNVILHVVWENDCTIDINGWEIPVLELKNRVDVSLLQKFSILQQSMSTFPCQRLISKVDSIFMRQMMDSSLLSRLERKTKELIDLDPYQLIYVLLSKAIGGKVNQFAFEYMSQYLPYSFVEQMSVPQRKMTFASHNGLNLNYSETNSQLFFGFKRKGMRPSSFPEKRLIQLSNLVSLIPVLFDLLELTVEEFIFQFRKRVNQLDASITYDLQNLLLINGIVPFLFVYGMNSESASLQEKAITILQLLPPEKNNIVLKMRKLGFVVNNSFDSQAILEIYNEFCSKKKCMNCVVGMKIINS